MECLVFQVGAALHITPEVFFHAELVLGGGRHDLGLLDEPLLIELVAVVENSARRLRHTVTKTSTGIDLDRGPLRSLV